MEMKSSLRGVGIILLIPLIILTGNSSVGAASTPASSAHASGLSISPLRQDLSLKPGQADKINVTLKNITGGPIVAHPTIQDFESDNVTGNPKIITDPNTKSPSSIKNFLVGLGDVPLATGEQFSFSVPVQIPANTPPGAYFGLLEYRGVPNTTNNANGNNIVALSAAVSQLVFITVPGNVSDRMQLTSIHVYHDKKGASEGVFFTSVPQSVGIELKNIGNAFAKPFGHISLQNSTGKEIYAYELNGSITRELVLPNSTRIFVDQLKHISHPGRYTIVANISYGPGSVILTGKKTFWYIQTWVIVVAVAVVLLLIVLAWLAWRRYKRATARQHLR